MNVPLCLPPRLDLPATIRLVTDLRALNGVVCLDASQVRHIGALALQALIVAARDAKARGGSFEINGVTEKVRRQMQIMGASPEQIMEATV